MSIMDKVKGAMNTVTGGGATVTLEHTGTFKAGGTITVKVGATSTGGEVKSKGVYVDLRGRKKDTVGQIAGNVVAAATHEFKVAEEFTLAAKETKLFESIVQIPADINADLDWEIRGRIDTFGNDPDSGFKDIR
jgi:hypothetical protein